MYPYTCSWLRRLCIHIRLYMTLLWELKIIKNSTICLYSFIIDTLLILLFCNCETMWDDNVIMFVSESTPRTELWRNNKIFCTVKCIWHITGVGIRKLNKNRIFPSIKFYMYISKCLWKIFGKLYYLWFFHKFS